ncbi:MAG: hypothetical protein NT011_04150 [Kiritimatiellaeota bacterium]|nr:hypothetical protein [Kiritimatiellota bacterium]
MKRNGTVRNNAAALFICLMLGALSCHAQGQASISCGEWTIRYDSTAKAWSAFNKGKPVVVNADAFIDTTDKQRALSSGEYAVRTETSTFEDELGKGKELKVILKDKENWMDAALSLRLYENKDWIFARLKIKNTSSQPQLLRELHLLRFAETGGLFIGNDPLKAKYMTQGWGMNDVYRVYPLAEAATGTNKWNWSPFVTALHNPASGENAVVGFSKNEKAFNWVNIRYDKNSKSPGALVQITAQSSYLDLIKCNNHEKQTIYHNESLPGTGVILSAGQEALSDELMINFSPDVLTGLEEFGDVTGRRQAMKIVNITPISWQSWNCLTSELLAGGINKTNVLSNLDACTKLLKPWGYNEYGLSLLLGWDGNFNLASDADAGKEIVANAKTSGYSLVYLGFYPTNSSPDPLPGEIVTLGFNHIYTDFMSHLLGQRTSSARDSSLSHAELYRQRYMTWTENIRQKAKEQGVDFIFTGFSGGPMGLSVGLVNSMRTGSDVASGSYSNWCKVVDKSKNPSKGTYASAYRVGAINSIMPGLAGRWWMHNRLWKNYLDSVKVGEPLGIDQARAWASLIGLSGQEFDICDKLAGEKEKYVIPPLDEERLAILRKVLPACDVQLQKGELFRPMGLWTRPKGVTLPSIYIRKISRPWKEWYLLGAFNLDDKNPQDVALDLSDLKWDWKNGYLLFDFWEEKFLGNYSEQPTLKVPPYGCRVLAVHRDTGNPQVLSSNRHITQGGVDLEDVSWDKERKILRGVSNGFPMQDYAIWVYVPPKFKYEKITANIPVEVKTISENVIKLTFNVSSAEPINWALQFLRE